MSDSSQVLSALECGESLAEEWIPSLDDEVRRLDSRPLAHEPPGQALQAIARVHDAWLKLAGDVTERRWNDRTHFFAAVNGMLGVAKTPPARSPR